MIINVYCNKMENQKLKMDNKINVNVLKHNSYNSVLKHLHLFWSIFNFWFSILLSITLMIRIITVVF